MLHGFPALSRARSAYTFGGVLTVADVTGEAIGLRLKAAREATGQTRAAVEHKLAFTPRRLEQYEQGRVIPDDPDLITLAREYRTHPAILRYGTGVLVEAALTEVAGQLTRVAGEIAALSKQLNPPVAPMDEKDRLAADEAMRMTAERKKAARKRRGSSG